MWSGGTKIIRARSAGGAAAAGGGAAGGDRGERVDEWTVAGSARSNGMTAPFRRVHRHRPEADGAVARPRGCHTPFRRRPHAATTPSAAGRCVSTRRPASRTVATRSDGPAARWSAAAAAAWREVEAERCATGCLEVGLEVERGRVGKRYRRIRSGPGRPPHIRLVARSVRLEARVDRERGWSPCCTQRTKSSASGRGPAKCRRRGRTTPAAQPERGPSMLARSVSTRCGCRPTTSVARRCVPTHPDREITKGRSSGRAASSASRDVHARSSVQRAADDADRGGRSPTAAARRSARRRRRPRTRCCRSTRRRRRGRRATT